MIDFSDFCGCTDYGADNFEWKFLRMFIFFLGEVRRTGAGLDVCLNQDSQDWRIKG